MNKWYSLNDLIKQEYFYKFIYKAESYGFQVSVDTDIEKLTIGEVDDCILDTYEEFCRLMSEGSVYEQIGFLMMEDITIEKLTLLKNDFRAVIYPNVVYLNGDIAELRHVFSYCGFNPSHWIGEEVDLK